MHTYIHAHAHTHTYVRTYVCMYVRTYMHAKLHTFIHMYVYFIYGERFSACASGNELMAAAGSYGCFRISWFVFFLAVKGSQAMLVLSTVGAQLSLH